MRTPTARLALGIALLVPAGCFTPTFRAVAEPEPPRAYTNDSTYAPRLAAAELGRVALVPPGQGWTMGDHRVDALTRGLVPAGITLTAVIDPGLKDGEALIKAKEEGAGAVLRIDEFSWSGDAARYFLQAAGPELAEVTQGEYDANPYRVRWKVEAPVLHLRARLLGEDRTALATYRLEGRLVDLPYPDSYGVSFVWDEGQPTEVQETPTEKAFGEQARRHMEEELLAALGREMPGAASRGPREGWPSEERRR